MTTSRTTTDALQMEQIDQLAAFIAAEHKVKLIPGGRWAADHLNGAIMYPRQAILSMAPNEARGHLWRTIQHLISSHGAIDPYSVAVDAALTVRDTLGVNAVHPRWIVPLFFHAERERATQLARHHGRNIESRALPRRGADYRTADLVTTLINLNTPPQSEADFWKVAAQAFELLLEGTIQPSELPEALNWDAAIVDGVLALLNAPTYDDLLTQVEALVLPIAAQRLRDLAEQEKQEQKEQEQDEDSSEGEPGDESSENGDDESESDDKEQSEDETEDEPENKQDSDEDEKSEDDCPDSTDSEDEDECPQPELSEDAQNEIEAEVGAESGDPIQPDFIDDKPDSENQSEQSPHTFDVNDMEHEAPDTVAPTWASVARGASKLITTIRDTLLAHLEDNEIGEVTCGTRSGRLDAPVAMRPAAMQGRRPFRRRKEADDRSYAIGIIVDTSGSMGLTTSAEHHADTFGPGDPQRWHTATRMTVALTEALSRLSGTELCIIAYHTPVTLVKGIRQTLDVHCKQRVMDNMGGFLNNSDAEALQMTINELAKSNAECKLIFHLTDGQFISARDKVRKEIARAAGMGIQVVILTLDLGPEDARNFVPAHMADQITDENVGRVLSKHLHRMLAAA